MSEIITTNNETFLNKIRSLISDCEEFIIFTGFFSEDGFNLIFNDIDIKARNGSIYIGHIFDNQKINLGIFKDNIDVYLIKNPNQIMHAKLYAFKIKKCFYVLIGSSNLTKNGIINNFEINMYSEITEKEYKQIHLYQNILDKFSININNEDKLLAMSKNSVKTRLYDELDYFFNEITQSNIQNWENEIKDYQNILCNAINNVIEDEWDTSQFKEEYLMKNNWAISESKHTDLWKRIKKHNPDTIFDKIYEMTKSIDDTDYSPDDVLATGKIPYVLGVSILSEILHKFSIVKYPIKNTRSSWGLLLIYDIGSSPEYILNEISYEKFIEYCDEIYFYYKEWFENKKLKLNEDFKYFYLDRLFLEIFDSEKYHEIIKIYRMGKHELY